MELVSTSPSQDFFSQLVYSGKVELEVRSRHLIYRYSSALFLQTVYCEFEPYVWIPYSVCLHIRFHRSEEPHSQPCSSTYDSFNINYYCTVVAKKIFLILATIFYLSVTFSSKLRLEMLLVIKRVKILSTFRIRCYIMLFCRKHVWEKLDMISALLKYQQKSTK